jgi:hypothetical protein
MEGWEVVRMKKYERKVQGIVLMDGVLSTFQEIIFPD